MSWLPSPLLAIPLFLGCAGVPPGNAPPPAPAAGVPVAAPQPSAEPAPTARSCSCSLKLPPAGSASAPPPAAATPPPISGDLPPGPFDLERRSACTARLCKLDGLLPDPSFLETTREALPAEGVVWLETIADKSTLLLPAAADVTALVLVLEGKVAFGQSEPKMNPPLSEVGPWNALRAPGVALYLQANGRASVLLALVSHQGTLADAIESSRKKSKAMLPAAQRIAKSDLASVPKQSWGGGAYHARVAFGGAGEDARSASLTLIQAAGQGAIAENVHAEEWEHIAFLRGSGEMLLGRAKYPVSAGSIFSVPQGKNHGWSGSGQEMAAVLVFSPSGPEQRFVTLGSGK